MSPRNAPALGRGIPEGRQIERNAGGEAQEYSTTDTPGPREAFLALFDGDLVSRRNPLAQFHHQAVRNFGAKSPSEIAVIARAAVRKRAVNVWSTPEEREQWRQVLHILNAKPPEWRPYCEWILEWERLPEAERERAKRDRGAEHRVRWMRTQPATAKQIDYLRALGYTGEIASKGHASELIDQLRGGAQP
jgi:hypothetical protein